MEELIDSKKLNNVEVNYNKVRKIIKIEIILIIVAVASGIFGNIFYIFSLGSILSMNFSWTAIILGYLGLISSFIGNISIIILFIYSFISIYNAYQILKKLRDLTSTDVVDIDLHSKIIKKSRIVFVLCGLVIFLTIGGMLYSQILVTKSTNTRDAADKKEDIELIKKEPQKIKDALSNFTKEALDYTPRNETKIVLIDGEQLAQLMIDYNLGCTTQQTYEIKNIDSDYFGEE